MAPITTADDDGTRTPTVANPNIFADDYETAEEVQVTDGFSHRSASPVDEGRGEGISGPTTARRSTSLNPPPDARRYSVSRSSTLKNYGPIQPAAGGGGLGKNQSIRSGTTAVAPSVRRSDSTTSSIHMNRSQSPFSGASGPSHPYAMYPQGTGVSRSASTATSSTIRVPPRSISDAAGPTHPYAMYPQNVFADPDDESVDDVQDTIPIGFPGRNQQFHRCIGADGEEQDIVGPDGHMEQLPPYTRYPEDAAGQNRPFNAGRSPGVTEDSAMNETLLHPPAESGNQQQQTTDVPQRSPFDDAETIAPDRDWDEKKRWANKSWSERSRTRFCGGRIPFWIILMAVGISGLVVGAVVAVAVGVVTNQHQRHHHGPPPSKTSAFPTPNMGSSLTDASPIFPTPSNIAALPAGIFSLPLNQQTQADSNSCLIENNQTSAWACAMPPQGGLSVLVESNGPLNKMANALITRPPSSVWTYGAQPPIFRNAPENLELVQDLFDPGRGPAYYFQTKYDKIVVVHNSSFQLGSNSAKREADVDFQPIRKDDVDKIQAGDQPWFCFWNSTPIEVFIYDMQQVPPEASSTAAASVSISTSADATASTGSSTGLPLTSGFATPLSTTTSAPVSSPAQAQNVAGAYGQANPGSSWTTHPAQSGYAYGKERRQAAPASPGPSPPPYPNVVKMVEKRMPDNNQPTEPYCQLMTILPNLQPQPAFSPDHNPITFPLIEQDPSSGQPPPQDLGRRQGSGNNMICGCEWLNE